MENGKWKFDESLLVLFRFSYSYSYPLDYVRYDTYIRNAYKHHISMSCQSFAQCHGPWLGTYISDGDLSGRR